MHPLTAIINEAGYASADLLVNTGSKAEVLGLLHGLIESGHVLISISDI
tara:strand:+ start:109 stop:255 length:147 start_codon:yes stop_codon:yes gene_type:complete